MSAVINKPSAFDPPAPPLLLRAGETALIFLLFFLYAGGEPPGVNESHYLCKAKHYWNPAWCPDDFFLQSADAHAMFYWTFGWLTRFTSLTTAAWIGRAITWLLQAWAWRRLSAAITPRPLFSLFSAGVFLALLHNAHLAGEWVVGDVEAKGIAYVFVFLGLEALGRQRWHWVFPLFGTAAAFHVIVGGWAVVAAGIAWLVLKLLGPKDSVVPAPLALAPSVVLGFLLSLPGLLPCLLLDRGTPAEIVDQGNVAYVYARLSHHLVIHRMPWQYMVRHAAVIVAGIALGYCLRGDGSIRRLLAFAAGAVALELVGVAIDQGLMYASDELRAKLLRYYWYRLGDALVPLTVALLFCKLAAGREPMKDNAKPVDDAPRAWLLIALLVAATWNIVGVRLERDRLGVPQGEDRLDIGDNAVVSLPQRHQDWVACCQWIEQNTAPDAMFLTPRAQQTFLWYAQRAEVVNWKNCPQDARGVVQWLKRYEDVYPDRSGLKIMYGPEIDLALPADERLRQLAEKYQAGYVVIDRFAAIVPQTLPRVYPVAGELNVSYAVYRIPNAEDGH
jgi:hypothetical protein